MGHDRPQPVASAAAPPVPPDGYEPGEEIGRGGMGVGYRVREQTLDRPAALKVLQARYAGDPEAADRFLAEARVTGRLPHPAVPPVHRVGTLPDGRPYLARKLVRGRTLHDLLRDRPDPAAELPRFVGVFEAVCQGVDYAHSRGVAHRDLKPANVMVGEFGEVQVMDWGLANERGEGDDRAEGGAGGGPGLHPSHTAAGAVLGTPAYMAPEQARGDVAGVDERADVFGLGAVLCVVLTGRPPFAGGDAGAVRAAAARGDLTAAHDRLDACGADAELVALCKRCLGARPADRPADAGVVAREVAGFRAAAEARARQAELDRVKAEAAAAEQRKRRRVQHGLAAAVAVLVVGAVAVAAWQAGQKRNRTTRATAAVAALLDQAKAALETGDAARAAPPLTAAEQRAADDPVDDHADQLGAYRIALGHLRVLDDVDHFRWNWPANPTADRVVGRWAAAFRDIGIVPGTTPPDEAAARVRESPVRAAFLAALHGWLVRAPSAPLCAILDAADEDVFRSEVRRDLAAQDRVRLAALLTRREWDDQPGWLVVAYSASPAITLEDERRLLARVARRRPDDFGLMMQLGGTYLQGTPDGSGDGVRWFQTAVGLRPASAAARLGLGVALAGKGDYRGAEDAIREAIRLAPTCAASHNGLGNVLHGKGDLAGAEASYREAIRIDANFANPHNGLGNILWVKGNRAGAEAAYREAIRLDRRLSYPHNGLANVLYRKGDLAGAEAAYREAIRLDPRDASQHNNLGILLWDKGDLVGAGDAFREAVRLDPRTADHHYNSGLVSHARFEFGAAESAFAEALRQNPRHAGAHVELGDVYLKTGRYAAAAASGRKALDVEPNNRLARDRLDFCLRVQRGEVPTAPPPRPAGR